MKKPTNTQQECRQLYQEEMARSNTFHTGTRHFVKGSRYSPEGLQHYVVLDHKVLGDFDLRIEILDKVNKTLNVSWMRVRSAPASVTELVREFTSRQEPKHSNCRTSAGDAGYMFGMGDRHHDIGDGKSLQFCFKGDDEQLAVAQKLNTEVLRYLNEDYSELLSAFRRLGAASVIKYDVPDTARTTSATKTDNDEKKATIDKKTNKNKTNKTNKTSKTIKTTKTNKNYMPTTMISTVNLGNAAHVDVSDGSYSVTTWATERNLHIPGWSFVLPNVVVTDKAVLLRNDTVDQPIDKKPAAVKTTTRTTGTAAVATKPKATKRTMTTRQSTKKEMAEKERKRQKEYAFLRRSDPRNNECVSPRGTVIALSDGCTISWDGRTVHHCTARPADDKTANKNRQYAVFWSCPKKDHLFNYKLNTEGKKPAK